MRILVTNDDGIDSVGLHVLARAMRPHGDVVIIAPDSEYSGASAAVGALHLAHPEARRRHVDGIDEAWSLTGPPALCVMFARLGAFGGPFDLVVSGINPGANVGRSVYHSGTIGATLSGRIGNISGVAVSQSVSGVGIEGQALGRDDPRPAVGDRGHRRQRVRRRAGRRAARRRRRRQPQRAELRGRRDQGLAAHHASGAIPQRPVAKAELVPIVGQNGAFRVAMEWGDELDLPPETDGGAVEDGYVSITYLSRLHEIDRPDMELAEQGARPRWSPPAPDASPALAEPADAGGRPTLARDSRAADDLLGVVADVRRSRAAHTAMHSATRERGERNGDRISHARADGEVRRCAAHDRSGSGRTGRRATRGWRTRRPTATT